jgi:hypothetical protein
MPQRINTELNRMENIPKSISHGKWAQAIHSAAKTGPVIVLLPTGELAQEVAAAYLAAQGWTRALLKLDEYDQLVERLSLDIVAYHHLMPVQGQDLAVTHWAWFAERYDCASFCSVLRACSYQVLDMAPIGDSSEHLAHFAHVGRCQLDDLCSHTMFLARQALSSGGLYDGWHTQYEGMSLSACVRGFQSRLDGFTAG